MTVSTSQDAHLAPSVERFANAANGMTKKEIELCVVQVEAIVAAKNRA